MSSRTSDLASDQGGGLPEHSQFRLLRERRFAPFFWTQFLGAGNDNIYKNALVIFVAFQAATLTTLSANDLVNIAAAVFIAPFVLFSATSGQLADQFEKSRLIRFIKLFEIAIMVLGAIGFYRRNLWLLFAVVCTARPRCLISDRSRWTSCSVERSCGAPFGITGTTAALPAALMLAGATKATSGSARRVAAKSWPGRMR